MKKTVALSAVAVLALSACGGDGDAGANGNSDGELAEEFNIAWSAQPPTLDPMMTTANTTRDIARNFYEPLVTVGNDGEVHPVLASELEMNEDNTVMTFTMREGLTFHDGSEVTEEDVIASVNRWIELSIVGQGFFEGSEVESPEDGVITVTLPESMFVAPMLMADQSQPMAIMKAEIIDSAPAEGVTEHIGTGPFVMEDWVTDQHIQLTRFEDYLSPEGEPNGDAGAKEAGVENIYYRFVSDSSTRVAGVQSGQYDAADFIPWDNANVIEEAPNVDLNTGVYGIVNAIINKSEGVMADPLMRQAVMAAIEPEENLQAAFASEEFYEDDGAFVPQDSPWYVEANDELRREQDLDLVEDLLDEAGYDGEVVRLLTTRDYDHLYNISVVLQEQLEAVGINTDLQVTDWATVVQNREDPGAWEIFVTGNGWGTVPVTFPFLQSSWAGWTEDEAIDEAVEAIVYGAANEQDAIAAVGQLQDAIYDYIPVIKFGDQFNTTAISTDWDGYEYAYLAGDLFYRVHPADAE